MLLSRSQLTSIAPFDDVAFPFCDETGASRLLTVVHGGGGVGKSTLIHALANTRPGNAVAQASSSDEIAFAICDWTLGDDEPERPHTLQVMSPNARIIGREEEMALLRREQSLFDRRARSGGFVFVALPATRWFSRQPLVLSAPGRSLARYDVRSTSALEDSTRSDLARETKQSLAYAELATCLAKAAANTDRDAERLGEAMREVMNTVAPLTGFAYAGLDARSFEPLFQSRGGRALAFDALPTHARNLIAFVAIPLRVLWSAYPNRDPRQAEGVVAIDDADLHLDVVVQEQLASTLRLALPRVQWILTTASTALATSVSSDEVLALRRLPEDEHVELFTGSAAQTH